MTNLPLTLKKIGNIYLGNIAEKNAFFHFSIGSKNSVLLSPHQVNTFAEFSALKEGDTNIKSCTH